MLFKFDAMNIMWKKFITKAFRKVLTNMSYFGSYTDLLSYVYVCEKKENNKANRKSFEPIKNT